MDFLRRLGRTKRNASRAELAVARHILAGEDPRLTLLWRQLEYAPVRRSRPDPSAIEVAPEYTIDPLCFPFEVSRLDSPWQTIHDEMSDRDLQFRVVIVRGGILKALEGRTLDGGPWPERWQPSASSLAGPVSEVQLPSAEAIEAERRAARSALEAWLARPVAADLDTFPAASDPSISSRELALGGKFPESLREFYRISDGLESKDYRLLGHADAYVVDNPSIAALLVAWDGDDRDDFVVVVSLSGSDEQVYRIDIHSDPPKPTPIAPDFRAYLAKRLPSR